MSRVVFVNGRYLPEDDATVSIFDRGYLFGDGVYEVVPVLKGRLIDKRPFLERLERSLGAVGIAWPMSADDYIAMHEELVIRNALDEGVIYSQVTRGVAERDFAFPENTPSGVMAFTQSKTLLDNPQVATGIRVVTVEDLRWKRRDIKSISLLAQCLAKQQASIAGAAESWMVEDGYVTEGSSSSAYLVKDGAIITRPLSRDILPGIRRRVLLEATENHGVKVIQRPFTVAEAYDADEAFISSATNFIMPVTTIDDRLVSGGAPGPVSLAMRELYLSCALTEAGVSYPSSPK